jgi:hypothetical protein
MGDDPDFITFPVSSRKENKRMGSLLPQISGGKK